MKRTLTAILTHQRATEAAAMAAWWAEHCRGTDALVVYGGPPAEFAALDVPRKVLVSDPRLRTVDHQRERQSFHGVFSAIGSWLAGHPQYERIHFTEYDCVPLCDDLPQRLDERLGAEQADVIGCRVERIDGTNHPHYLYHTGDAGFRALIRRISVRQDRRVVLAMLGCMSFWKRRAFEAVAAVDDSSPYYLELTIPTVAHHLGYRVRGMTDQSAFVRPDGNPGAHLAALRSAGAWMAHPVKDWWRQG